MCFESFYSNGFANSLTTLTWSLLLALLNYIVLHRPCIEIFDEGVHITNPLTTVSLGWQDVDVIEAKYTAFLQLRNGNKIRIWCAQTPGRYHSRTVHSSEIRGLHIDGYIRPGESPRTDSGVVTYLLRTRLIAFRGQERSDGLSYTFVREEPLIAGVAILVSAIVLMGVLHN